MEGEKGIHAINITKLICQNHRIERSLRYHYNWLISSNTYVIDTLL